MIMPDNTETPAELRKKLLIAQGAIYRLRLGESKNAVRTNLQPEALAKSAVNSFVSAASARLGNGLSLKTLGDANWQTVLPLLISVVSLLAKRKSLIKPLLLGGVAFAIAGAAARLVLRKKPDR